jgi:protein SCO1/2
MNRRFAGVQGEIKGDAALRGRVRLLSISIDPDFDTPAVLADQARRIGADPAVWTFLTGDREAIERFGRRFGVSVIRGREPIGITHNLRTAVVGADGRLVTMVGGTDWSSADLLAALRRGV